MSARPGDAVHAAVLHCVVEEGYERLSVESICQRAGIEREEFGRRFASPEGAFLATYDLIANAYTDRIMVAYEAGGSWREGLRAAAYTFAWIIEDDPEFIQFGTIAVFAAGNMAQAHRDRVVRRYLEMLDGGRQELDDPDSLSIAVAEGVMGAVYGTLVKEVRTGGALSPAEHVPELLYIAVRPYLGHAVALEELEIPPPPRPRPGDGGPRRYRPGVATSDLDDDGAAPGLPRLPPGRHGLSREFVTRNQLDRLTAGMIATVAEHGYHDTTISQIAEAAGISRRTFYGYFSGKEECFFATFQVIFDYLQETMTAASAGAEAWPEQVRARLGAMLEVFAANPDLVRFTMIAPQVAGGEIAARYRTLLEQLGGVLKGQLPAEAREPSPAAEQGLLGAASALLVREVREGRGEELMALLPDLVELVLSPYLGREQAVAAARR